MESDGLDIPAFLRISQAERRAAWESFKGFPDQGKPILDDDRGPGAVCRRLGIPTGVNESFASAVQAREAADKARRKEESLARLTEWKRQQAEIEATKARARALQSKFLKG